MMLILPCVGGKFSSARKPLCEAKCLHLANCFYKYLNKIQNIVFNVKNSLLTCWHDNLSQLSFYVVYSVDTDFMSALYLT